MIETAGKILIVEDDEFMRSINVRQVNNLGYWHVVTADNGVRAMEILRAGNIDLVLLDIEMPELNGIEVLRRMKADIRFKMIPVIMITGVDEIGKAVSCIELGAEDYLAKPFSPMILRARISACLEKVNLRRMEASFLTRIHGEQKIADDLLNVILPESIADELKAHGSVKPSRYENVAVLFSDIVDFTAYCNRHDVAEVVANLQTLVERFEEITEQHQMEKIKTIGDAFMATAGMLRPNSEPLSSALQCGLDMISAARDINKDWEVRVGVDCGQLIGGVIGRKKYQFDVWGNAVNTAARMAEYAAPRTIAMTHSASLKADKKFTCRTLEHTDVKGLGQIGIVQCNGIRRE
jgi:adenylate cyclase